MTLYVLAGSCFLFGLALGSFLNVVIYRVPRDLSIVRPGSSCPTCGRMIRAWENIPVISYVLILKGRCAGCSNRISLQYPVVEIVTGLLFAAVALRYGPSFKMIVYLVYTAMLIALSVIDIQTKLLPNAIVLPGLLGACLLALGTLYPPFEAYWSISPVDAFLGMLVGGMPLFFLAWGYLKLTGREGMGGGDIKLMFFTGALLGPMNAFLTLFIGSLTGSVIGITYMKLRNTERHVQIPFGPFLSLGAWIAMMWGNDMIQWYLVYMGLMN
jgi:leader peptidase (prepilin peptidase) / N-methyltransferase